MRIHSSILAAPPLAVALALSSCLVVEESSTSSTSQPAIGQSASSAIEDAASQEVPELRTKQNGDIEVVFTKKGCVVLFDRNGNLKSGGRGCDDLDLHRAKVAVRAHLAEQSADFSDV